MTIEVNEIYSTSSYSSEKLIDGEPNDTAKFLCSLACDILKVPVFTAFFTAEVLYHTSIDKENDPTILKVAKIALNKISSIPIILCAVLGSVFRLAIYVVSYLLSKLDIKNSKDINVFDKINKNSFEGLELCLCFIKLNLFNLVGKLSGNLSFE